MGGFDVESHINKAVFARRGLFFCFFCFFLFFFSVYVTMTDRHPKNALLICEQLPSHQSEQGVSFPQ